MKPTIRLLLALLLSACASGSAALADDSRKMNLVFIMADDLGWSDTTLYGHSQLYETPNVERLARMGMKFTRAYSASPLCSPTRASVLTGLTPARTGITSPSCHVPEVQLAPGLAKKAAANVPYLMPTSVTRLRTTYPTLVKSLKSAGYATAHFGKWHLGAEPYSALDHGFDVDMPHWPGPGPAGSFVAPWKFPKFKESTPGEHIEDRMAREAAAFIDAHKDQPFYMNYWMFSVHAPFNAKASLIEKYRKKIDKSDPQHSPTYAAMVESMDDAIGSLLDALERNQLLDKTLIVFTSDNGGNMYNTVDETTPTSNRPLRGGKATVYEGGIRVPLVVHCPGRTQAGSSSAELVNSCDYFPTCLELLDVKPETKLQIDGSSFAAALSGQPLRDKVLFTYFPHSPPVPDWQPPAVVVHRGDWKLIRLFYSDAKQANRHKLFNVREDIGERNDQSASHPELVAELSSLIDQFLQESKAVTPQPNPAFVASKYDMSLEGKPAPKHFGGGSEN